MSLLARRPVAPPLRGGSADARHGLRTLLRVTASILALSIVGASSAAPATKVLSEYDVKAAFLFNFAHFVEWPAEAFADTRAPFTIGILGTDPFGSSLDQIVTDESIGAHALRVRRFQSPQDIDSCQILFISQSERGHLREVVAKLQGQRILTVGDMKDFAKQAGMIGFVTAQNRLRLQINLGAAKDSQLKISSQLLRQAEIVGRRGGRQ